MKIIEVDDKTFDQQIWKSGVLDKGGAVVVVEFIDGVVRSNKADAPKRSEKMSILLDELADDYADSKALKFFRVDYLKSPTVAARYDIQSAPTLLLLQIEEVVGGNTKEWIKAKIDKKLST